jgi:NAD(P)-dependent dehydrogenase (short-subunit alcohol dehydrogenase family)
VPVAIITGSDSGIGRATAVALARDGYDIGVTWHEDEAGAQATADEVRGTGRRAEVRRLDLSDAANGPRVVDELAEALGGLDVLVNNSGTGTETPVLELDLETWRHVLEVDLTGAFLCAQAAFRAMRDQQPRGGRIINNGSISAHVPRPHSAAYTATKHAVTGLTRAISLEGREYDIACGQIDIGNAATDMTEAMARGVPQADGSIAAEPRMDARDVADAVLMMARLPLDANVQFLTIMATAMPYIGRG